MLPLSSSGTASGQRPAEISLSSPTLRVLLGFSQVRFLQLFRSTGTMRPSRVGTRVRAGSKDQGGYLDNDVWRHYGAQKKF